MSDLAKAFPHATFIPFNPRMPSRVATAKQDDSTEMIIVESSIRDWSIVPPDGMVREDWIVKNAVNPILEVGCQKGHIFKNPNRQFKDLAEWYGFDLDVWEQPNFAQGDAHHLPYKDNAFNTVVIAEILEHVEDPKQVLFQAMRVARERVLITVPNEHVWGKQVLPFMKLEDKNAMDGLTHRQQIDKNSRWLEGCLNPKDYVAPWDEERYEHLWHKRHFYQRDDVNQEPPNMAGNGKPEIEICDWLAEATKEYDETFIPVQPVSNNWHYEKLTYYPWGAHCAVIQVDGVHYMSMWEFKHLFDTDDDWFGQIMSTVDGRLIGFLRRI